MKKKTDFSIDGSLAIVTGGNSGIGRETAQKLSSAGARVIIACRSIKKAEAASLEIGLQSGNPVDAMELDLSVLDSIRIFSENFLEIYGVPDVLVNNAGVYMRKYRETDFGMEMSLAVNYLGPFYLSNLLLPHMASIEDETRIINVTSDSYHVRNFNPSIKERKHYSGFSAYSQSKRALMYFTFELAERLGKTKITVNCVDPGHASTAIWPSDAIHWKLAGKIISLFADPPSYAAENVFFASASPELTGTTGKYISNISLKNPKEGAFEEMIQKTLWDETLEYLNELL